MLFKKEVIVCKKCGEKVPANYEYCPKCGESIKSGENKPIERQVFAGQVKKCPNCGAVISSYTFKCPDCGIELTNLSNDNSSINEFSKKIVEYDQRIAAFSSSGDWTKWGIGKKIGWIVLNIYTIGIPALIYYSKRKNSPNGVLNAEKKSFVENYSFPNDRQSVLDAIIFVRDRLLSLSTNKTSSENNEWASIWRNKLEHLYRQAELLFPNDSIANEAYNTALVSYNKIQENKKKHTRNVIIIIIAVVLLSYLYTYITNLLGIQH